MADVVRTIEKTKVITFQTGLGSITDEYPVDLDKIKILGLYTAGNLETLKELFFDLLETLDRDGASVSFELHPHQVIEKVLIKRDRLSPDAGTATRLISTTLRPDDPNFVGDKRSSLFLVDVVSLLLGIATTLQREFYPKRLKSDLLKEFALPNREEDLLKEWGRAQGKDYISQEAIAREKVALDKLVAAIYRAFIEIENNKEEPGEQTEEAEIEVKEAEATPVPEDIDDVIVALERELQNQQSADHESTVGEFSAEPVTSFAEQRRAVFLAAKANLIDQLLEQSGLTVGELPTDLQGLHQQLVDLLEQEIDTVFADLQGKLTEEEYAHLLQGGSAAATVRLKLYRLLLQELLYSSSSNFFVLYQDFCEGQVAFITQVITEQTATPEQRQQAIAALSAVTTVISNQILDNPDLAIVHGRYSALRSDLLQRITDIEGSLVQTPTVPPDEKTVFESTDHDDQEPPPSSPDSTGEDTGPLLSPNDIPASPIVLTTAQVTQITAPSQQTFSVQEKTVLTKQAGHVVWGTLAQLFPEETLRQGAVPPALFEQVNSAAIEYLAGLSPAELHKLSKSPSSLIRHIKNLSLRMQTDVAFVPGYEAFKQTVAAPVIDRTERIEIEANWAIENSKYELFTAHNITSDLITRSPQLEKEYLEAEQKLEAKVYALIMGLSTQELLDLYLNPDKRTELFNRITQTLNADPTFKRELSEFYTELIAYYKENNLPAEEKALSAQLAEVSHVRIVQQEGAIRFVIEDIKHVDNKNLFIDQLKAGLQDDSEVVLQNTTTILDSLLLTYGPEATANLVEKVDTRLLGIMFNLPTNEINASNHQTIRQILINYAKVRVNNLAPAAGPVQRGYLEAPPTIPTTEVQALTMRQPVQNMAKFVQDNGTEATTEALSGNIRKKTELFVKIVSQQWNNLTVEEAAAIWVFADRPIPEDLRQRLVSHSTDLFSDKAKLHPIPEFLLFKGEIKDLLLAAEAGKFRELVYTTPPSARYEGPDTPEAHAYKQAVAEQRLQHQIAYAQWAAQTEAEQTRIATELATTVEEIEQQYIAAITARDQYVLEVSQQLSDLDAAAIGVGVTAGAMAATQALPAAAQVLPAAAPQIAYSSATKATGLGQLASGAIKNRIFNATAGKLGFQAAGAAMGVASGPLGWITVAKTIWDNPELRRWVSGLGTWGASQLLYVLTNFAGMASLGGALWLLGPAGLIPGFVLGSVLSYQLPWLQMPGLGVRFPANPFATGADAAEQSVRGYKSMSEMRTANTAASQTQATQNPAAQSASGGINASNDSGSSSGSAGSTSNNATAQSATANANATTTSIQYTSTATSAGNSLLSLANVGLIAPLVSLVPPLLITLLVVTVIAGSFLIELPTKPGSKYVFNSAGEQASAKYVDVTKTADKGAQANDIRNNTATDITYSIVIAPKPGYSIKVNEASDKFTSFGDQTTDLTSPLEISQVPSDPFQTPSAPITYTINTGTGFKDAFITNTFTIVFDVLDYSGNVVESNQSFYTAASVMVGEPKIGCWPVTGSITTTPFDLSVPTHAKTDAFDIGADPGTPIHAPFPGMVTDRGWNTQGYGNLMALEFVIPGDSTKRTVFFAHLSKVADKFKGKQNTPANAGEVIGFVGSTGNSTGPHLHYELINTRDKATDPGLGIRNIVPNGLNAKLWDRVYSCK